MGPRIVEFLLAVLTKWQGYVTGGILVALMFALERKMGREIAWKYFRVFLAASLFVSFFLAWSDQRNLKDILDRRTTQLLDRINAPHRLDPAIENLGSIVGAFSGLERTMGDNKCAILITEPRGGSIVGDALFLGSGLAGCPSGGHGGITESPTAEANRLVGEDPNAVVIHAPEDAPGILALFDSLGPIVNVRRSYDPLPGLAPGIVWIQVGANARWNRQIEDIELDPYLAR